MRIRALYFSLARVVLTRSFFCCSKRTRMAAEFAMGACVPF